jgi:hypothetical protein
MAGTLQEQIDRNYDAFTAQLPELIKTHRGKFALMRDGQIVDFFDTARDADTAARKLYPDHVYSVQEVVDTAVDLGFFSHAVPDRAV